MKAQKVVVVLVLAVFTIIGVFGEAFASSKKNRPTTEVEAFKNSSISSSSRSSSKSSISRSGNSSVTVQNIISSGSSRSGRGYRDRGSHRGYRRGGSNDNNNEMLYGIGGALIGGALGYVIGNQNRQQQPVVVQPAAYPQQNPPQATATAEVVINGMRCVHAGYDQTGAAILRCSR